MNDERLRTAYGRAIAGRNASRADCVSPEALESVADGRATEDERLRTLAHVGGCRHCRADLDLLRAAGETARRVTAPARFSVPVWAAAAVVLLVAGIALWQPLGDSSGEPLRGPGLVSDVRLIAPVDGGLVPAPVTLAWSSVPATRRYEVEILDSSGVAVFATATGDTSITVSNTRLVPGTEYRWWVRATLANGGQRRSITRRLRITP
jgi:hypothetical protein